MLFYMFPIWDADPIFLVGRALVFSCGCVERQACARNSAAAARIERSCTLATSLGKFVALAGEEHGGDAA